jgi:hypothetical protein
MTVRNESKLALGDMHAAHVRHLMMAERDGKTIQRYTNGWHDVREKCNWYLDNVYRVKPNIELRIPWEVIDRRWQWAAMDRNLEVFMYPEKPKISENYDDMWVSGGEDYRRIDHIVLFDNLPDHSDWKFTLTKRPNDV